MDDLKISVSGIRGIVGKSFTAEKAGMFAASFGKFLGSGTIVVGRDSRVSGPVIKDAVIAGLFSSGCEVVDIGVSTTPSTQIMVEELNSKGGIVVTASHNPGEWNGLKFIKSDGTFLNSEEFENFSGIFKLGEEKDLSSFKQGTPEKDDSVDKKHISRILDNIDTKKIKNRALKVVVDCCNGAGVSVTNLLCEKLGCSLTTINDEQDGIFRRIPEPRPENLSGLEKKVAEVGADVGFAQDPDGDRLVVVSQDADCLIEEITVALAVDFVLKYVEKGPVCVNLSTTKAVDDVACRYNVPVYRSKVGEINVVEEMRRTGAIIGGEGNGGIIYPRVHYGRDSLVGIALILAYMAEEGSKISEIVSGIPCYRMVKKKVEVDLKDPKKVFKVIADKFGKAELDYTDGLKVSFEDSWVHIRSSNTEPVIRIIAEGKSDEKANELVDIVEHALIKE